MADAGTLTPRQEMLPRLIIKEHVETGQHGRPRVLVERYDLGVSPATVRNEMAHLEELGYLLSSHTSAAGYPRTRAPATLSSG